MRSQGALLFAFHGGKSLEAGGFADDAAVEDRHFGESEASDSAAVQLGAAFEAATPASKLLKKALDNTTPLDRYARFRQAGSDDASDERPGVMDVVGRAKFGAWTRR